MLTGSHLYDEVPQDLLRRLQGLPKILGTLGVEAKPGNGVVAFSEFLDGVSQAAQAPTVGLADCTAALCDERCGALVGPVHFGLGGLGAEYDDKLVVSWFIGCQISISISMFRKVPALAGYDTGDKRRLYHACPIRPVLSGTGERAPRIPFRDRVSSNHSVRMDVSFMQSLFRRNIGQVAQLAPGWKMGGKVGRKTAALAFGMALVVAAAACGAPAAPEPVGDLQHDGAVAVPSRVRPTAEPTKPPTTGADTLLESILSGGDPRELDDFRQLLRRDSIEPIYDPQFVRPPESGLRPDDLVMGVSINSDSRAYPIRYLQWREMVNDEVGGIPILVTW